MFKCCIVCLGLLQIFRVSEAQEEFDIKGRVTDAAGGGPLIGAQVLTASGRGAVTDRSGRFALRLSGGSQEITITFLGYSSRKARPH